MQGDLDDTSLLDLVPFLEALFKEDIQDVRDVTSPQPYANLKSFCKSQFPRKSVNLLFILVIVKDK